MKHFTLGIGVFSIMTLSAMLLSANPRGESPAGIWESMRAITPHNYVCHFTEEPITIDGKMDEEAWQRAPWTEDFQDIEGQRKPKPRFRTRAKMLWDANYFYVYAEMEEPHVWATITEKNKVMFHDNDFEVFIDPDGDNHNYYEFEMNAHNTIWELSLDKPYRDGGPVRNPNNLEGLQSAVHIRGTLNDPSDTDKGWSVEIAFPWKELAKYTGDTACPPQDQDIWRVNFSRVEWLADIIDGKYRKIPKSMRNEDNWVWSPQGIIDMHRPERWGFVQFTKRPSGEAEFTPDPTWPARELLMEIYHRQKAFQGRHNHHAETLAQLGINPDYAPKPLIKPLQIERTEEGFTATATVELPDGTQTTLHTRHDSRLWQEK